MANDSLRICLDPGHAGTANRGVVDGYWESHMVYDLAYKLKERLEKYKNVTVFVTKPVLDCNPDLDERGEMAGKNNCEVFLSLHSNAASAAACGVSIFKSVKRPDSSSLGKQLGQAVVDVMRPGTGNTYLRDGGNSTKLYPNTSNTDYYGVIRSSVRYSCVKYSYIIEHGFHTNVAECRWLYNSDNVSKLADAECKVLANYFGLSLKEEETPVDPTPSGKIKEGDIVQFLGGPVYGNANATSTNSSAKAGPAKVTRVFDGKHPYHLIHTDETTTVYGWVNSEDVYKEKEEEKPTPSDPKEGDIVQFKGGAVYGNANAESTNSSAKAGPAKITRIYDGKHPYHIVHTNSQSTVYGWVDASTIGVYESEASPNPDPKPDSKPDTCPYSEPTRELTNGHTGDDVRWVQWYLTHDGYPITIDGIFGTNTDKKVRQFQKDQKINVDGWVGKDTRERLKNPKNIKTNPYNEPTSDIRKGATGEGVRWIQWELVEAGYNISVDGIFGTDTDNSVRDFQRKNNLTVDGWVGKNTRAKLKAN